MSGAVDPGGRAFEFGVGADGGLVDDDVAREGSSGRDHSVRYFS